MHHVNILDDGRAISLTNEGWAKLRFHAIWLRDNAWDAGTRAPGKRPAPDHHCRYSLPDPYLGGPGRRRFAVH